MDLGWSMLRDITRLGNDNHSQIARIKKPDGSRAWDLDTLVDVLGAMLEVSRLIDCDVCEIWTFDSDNTFQTFKRWDRTDFATFVIRCHFHVDSP